MVPWQMERVEQIPSWTAWPFSALVFWSIFGPNAPEVMPMVTGPSGRKPSVTWGCTNCSEESRMEMSTCQAPSISIPRILSRTLPKAQQAQHTSFCMIVAYRASRPSSSIAFAGGVSNGLCWRQVTVHQEVSHLDPTLVVEISQRLLHKCFYSANRDAIRMGFRLDGPIRLSMLNHIVISQSTDQLRLK